MQQWQTLTSSPDAPRLLMLTKPPESLTRRLFLTSTLAELLLSTVTLACALQMYFIGGTLVIDPLSKLTLHLSGWHIATVGALLIGASVANLAGIVADWKPLRLAALAGTLFFWIYAFTPALIEMRYTPSSLIVIGCATIAAMRLVQVAGKWV